MALTYTCQPVWVDVADKTIRIGTLYTTRDPDTGWVQIEHRHYWPGHWHALALTDNGYNPHDTYITV